MAQNNIKVLLGFEDELITEKYKNQVNFTTNKIGGKPDLPSNIKLEPPICPLCQLPRPLVVQVYAPLESSPYHRTLYLFACINPNCWNQSESWICIRVQSQEKLIEHEEPSAAVTSKTSVTDWCADADDWDDNNANMNEENGNLINNIERVSDEDDESCSFEESVRTGLGNLTVDDRNANNGAFGGAVGRLHSPSATAEIEGDEGEVVTIDSPVMPQQDIVALLQEATPLPQLHGDPRKSSLFQFISSFMGVWEETAGASTISDRHVKELLQEYQQKNEDDMNLVSPDTGGASAQIADNVYEKYEKSNPAHGDKMFHHFLSKIQMNPSQILRYNRDSAPLLLYPLQGLQTTCNYCKGDLVFEFQVLPTIIPKLKLVGDAKHCSRLEFGTVLVFTCRKSCWSTDTNTRHETVIVQSEVY
ncbi:programmed cell death protein 2-like [Tribolium castaneum]|uniref:Programmed cell death protein 2-like n=2 Tax=Tribolium castaneum TaxID=7070 RepID=A0A139WMF8_TRICA|nr:PREDICTED: programmed cell death protein 2-like [Tribolium castaneum]KYB29229.1 Programmed cell death protein 2-like [Tribolium castaneum]|eukprot:XP_008201158.1 PREDICTED: programmed cell death protein 2-like [Tribolium castaneum]